MCEDVPNTRISGRDDQKEPVFRDTWDSNNCTGERDPESTREDMKDGQVFEMAHKPQSVKGRNVRNDLERIRHQFSLKRVETFIGIVNLK